MKKYFKLVFIALISALFILTSLTFIKPKATPVFTQQTYYDKLATYQLSEAQLSSLTTQDLLNTVLEFPYLINMFLFDSYKLGYESVRDSYNGLKHLVQRLGVGDILLDKYQGIKILDDYSNKNEEYFELLYLEIFLTQEEIISNFTKDQMAELNHEVLLKYDGKCKQVKEFGRYTTIFYDCLNELPAAYPKNRLLSIPYNLETVYTQNNTPVQVIRYERDFDVDAAIKVEEKILQAYPNVIKIANPTILYNCHSYAWYQQSINNPYWMDNPSSYYQDGSYEVSNDNIGDKLCYYNSGDFIPTHSGIVINKIAGNYSTMNARLGSLTIESKWGNYGLYRHNGLDCPYVQESNTYEKYSTYRRVMEDSVDMYCTVGTAEKTPSLNGYADIIYQVNVLCPRTYFVDVTGPSLYEITLLDSNREEITKVTSTFLISYLTNGTYYVSIRNKTNGTVHTIIDFSPYYNVEQLRPGNNDALAHLHHGRNIFEYTPSKTGIYHFRLIAEKMGQVYYPEGSMNILDADKNLLQKVNYQEFDTDASNKEGLNQMYVHLQKWKTYYIEILYAEADLQSLQLELGIGSPNTIAFSGAGYYEDCFSVNLGDHFEYFQVVENGIYNITLFQDQLAQDALFVIFKRNSDGAVTPLSFTPMKASHLGYTITNTFLAGEEYYIGFFSNGGAGSITMIIDKRITETFRLILDPVWATVDLVGTEVTINGGYREETTITRGFTRCVFLGVDAPQASRLSYSWYSSNPSVARVSEYGTITAIMPGTTEIRAVYKNDSTIMACITITVREDTDTHTIMLYYGMDVRDGAVTAGTEVSSGLGYRIPVGFQPSVTIHCGKTRFICLGDDSPTKSLQDFVWETSNPFIAIVSMYGTIFAANSIVGTSNQAIITGTYRYNARFKVIIQITII